MLNVNKYILGPILLILGLVFLILGAKFYDYIIVLIIALGAAYIIRSIVTLFVDAHWASKNIYYLTNFYF